MQYDLRCIGGPANREGAGEPLVSRFFYFFQVVEDGKNRDLLGGVGGVGGRISIGRARGATTARWIPR